MAVCHHSIFLREVRLLGKQGKTAGESIIGQEAARLIYKAMRPNEDGFGFRIIERHPKSSNIKQIFGKNKPRGNIGVFVCPYIDCHHITDANIQAAFNIAVRGYFKSKWQEKYATENARKNNPLNKEALTKATAELKFQPISTFED